MVSDKKMRSVTDLESETEETNQGNSARTRFLSSRGRRGAPGYAGMEASSSQKRLPLPGVESTPTLPFMRSTALRTMARPTPVP